MRRDTARWAVASVVLHAVIVALLLVYSGPTFLGGARQVTFIDLSALAEGTDAPRQVDLPPVGGGAAGGAVPAPRPRRDTVPVPLVRAPRRAPPAAPDSAVAAAGPGGGRETAGTGAAVGALVAAPSYESGRLWIRPLDALARAGGEAAPASEPIDPATHVAKVDSAVRAKIFAFLDTLPADSFAGPRPQSWTTEIDGKKWGVDGSWIYLGDLRLPAAVLALLPLPQANFEQNQRAAALQRIREDIMEAAWRAESAEEFRRNVQELRERKDRERELQKNQTRPDSVRT